MKTSNLVNNINKVKSPFRYPGGKFYAVKYILPFLNIINHDEYREPFIGGGSIFFAKTKVSNNWINDIEPNLINVYKHIQDKEIFKDFQKLFAHEQATKERFIEILNCTPQNDLEHAFKTYYLNRTSYSGILHKPAWGYREGKSSPPQNWENFLIRAHSKLEDTRITCLDFENVITQKSNGNNVLLYLDPPYYEADQKRAYKMSFNIEDHYRLMNTLKNTSYYFCLSYDDCEFIRDIYSWANIHERSWLYNTANLNGNKRDLGKELIITNYKVSNKDLL